MTITASIPQAQAQICWAECLADCSVEGSREHLLTQATLKGPRLNFRGFPFLRGATAEIHKRNFRSNILCRHHNNYLSPVDEAGTDAFRVLREACGPTAQTEYEISGTMMERWLLKTLINYAVVTDFHCRPPKDLAEIVFGKRPFPQKAGFRYVGYAIQTDIGPDSMSVTLLHGNDASGSIVGGLFNVAGFECVVTWPSLASALTVDRRNGETLKLDEMPYRPHRIRSSNPAGRSIALSWS